MTKVSAVRKIISIAIALTSPQPRGIAENSFESQIEAMLHAAAIDITEALLVQDDDDPDRQTLLVRYPSVTTSVDAYITPQ